MSLKLQKCCFCLSLRTGSFIIGYLNMISSLFCIVLFTVGAVSFGSAIRYTTDPLGFAIGMVFLTADCIVLIFALLHFVFDILLLIGLHKHDPRLVKTYLYFLICIIVINIIVFIFSIVVDGSIYIILSLLFIILINDYFLIIIGSYYIEMNESPCVALAV